MELPSKIIIANNPHPFLAPEIAGRAMEHAHMDMPVAHDIQGYRITVDAQLIEKDKVLLVVVRKIKRIPSEIKSGYSRIPLDDVPEEEPPDPGCCPGRLCRLLCGRCNISLHSPGTSGVG